MKKKLGDNVETLIGRENEKTIMTSNYGALQVG